MKKRQAKELMAFQRSYHPGDESVSWSPPVDVYETDDHYVVHAELPGVEAGDVHIEIAGAELSIFGERRSDPKCCGESYERMESSHGRFHRTFSMPEDLSREGMDASLRDGVLRILLPRSSKRKAAGARTGE